MAKKGKEIDLGGVRVQVDPFILIRRVLMRQKLLVSVIGVVGAVLTVLAYKAEPKVYSSSATIAIRTESMPEDYVRKLINRAMRDMHANTERMLLINELDLFGSTRASLPYDIALRTLTGPDGLKVDQQQGSIGVSFFSKDPQQAQMVVAFATERVLGKLANLLDSPYRRQLEALSRGIEELEPKVQIARTNLFQFKAKHPEIAVVMPDLIREDSPLAGIQKDIERAELGLRACYAGVKAPVAAAPRARPEGPACQRVKELRRERADLLAQFTQNHPSVIAADQAIVKALPACKEEQARDSTAEAAPAPRAAMSQSECIEAAKDRIAGLYRDKADIEKQGIKKPELQRKWAELTVETNALEAQLRALQDRRAKASEDRLVGANEFQENFQLVDAPRVPELPTKPERNRFLMVGLGLTAFLGLGLALAREAFRQSFLDPAEFEEQTGVQVLAVLPEIVDR
jgi:uncharacterized protein involved in exopolysaccharide biosynthesis